VLASGCGPGGPRSRVLIEQGFTAGPWLKGLPDERRAHASSAMNEWILSYRTVEMLLWLLDVEGLGTAIALHSETRSLFPRDQQLVDKLGKRTGETLASAENAALWYGRGATEAGWSR
jgi:hypothetical protein